MGIGARASAHVVVVVVDYDMRNRSGTSRCRASSLGCRGSRRRGTIVIERAHAPVGCYSTLVPMCDADTDRLGLSDSRFSVGVRFLYGFLILAVMSLRLWVYDIRCSTWIADGDELVVRGGHHAARLGRSRRRADRLRQQRAGYRDSLGEAPRIRETPRLCAPLLKQLPIKPLARRR